jgi:predicted amidohydrolase
VRVSEGDNGGSSLAVALVTEVFHDPGGPDRLVARLREARGLGAELAVLPELPLNEWCPAGRTPSDADAEAPGGPREQAMGRAARAAGIRVLGGAIVQDPRSGSRHNTALLFDETGEVAARYRKLHLPWEEGYWEADHYSAGEELPRPVEVGGFPVGIQICSDINRPQVAHILSALGARAVLVPRATPPDTFHRWRIVFRSIAITAAVHVVSVNRPGPEPGTSMGGPSIVVAPDGEVAVETTAPLEVVRLTTQAVEKAREGYPGYLAVRGSLYARGWERAGDRPPRPEGYPRRN